MKRLLVFLFCASVVFYSCNDNQIEAVLTSAEMSMNDNPYSSLKVLDSIDVENLKTRKQKARYALLYSIALDKNYIDLQSDSIIAPAVKYYECHGSKEERFLCNYYYARIYENAGDNENALLCASKAESIDTSLVSADNLCLLYAMKGRIYHDAWRINDAIGAYLDASKYALMANKYNHYSFYLLQLSDLYRYNNDFANFSSSLEQAESNIEHFTLREIHNYFRLKLLYMMDSGVSTSDCLQFVEKYLADYPQDDMINWHIVSKVYLYAGDAITAYEKLKRYKENHDIGDSANYYGVLANVLESLGNHKDALSAYRNFASMVKDKDVARHISNVKLVEERYENKLIQNHQRYTLRYVLTIVLFVLIFMVVAIVKLNNERKRNKMDIADLHSELSALTILNERMNGVYKYLSGQVSESSSTNQEFMIVLGQRIKSLSAFLQKPVPDSLSKVTSQIEDLKKNKNSIIDSIGLLYAVRYPDFISELRAHELTSSEIGCCCLYLLGLNIPEVGEVIGKVSSIYNVNSGIRKKLGISRMNLDKWILKRFTELYPNTSNEKS
jgi:tetratricopeptide (TPR) repeat protein